MALLKGSCCRYSKQKETYVHARMKLFALGNQSLNVHIVPKLYMIATIASIQIATTKVPETKSLNPSP